MAVGIFKDGQVSNVAAGNTVFTVTNLPHGGWPFFGICPIILPRPPYPLDSVIIVCYTGCAGV